MTVCVVESENFSPISSGQGPFGGVGIETFAKPNLLFGFSHFSTLVDRDYDLRHNKKGSSPSRRSAKDTPVWTEIPRNAQDCPPRAKMKRIQP